MERPTTCTVEARKNFNEFEFNENSAVTERLNRLIALNDATEQRKILYNSDREQLEAEMMTQRLDLKQTFSYFGLMLGIFPPAAFFLKTFFNAGSPPDSAGWVAALMIVNILTAVVGYFSGRLIANHLVRHAERLPWWAMIVISPFIGIIWGIISGGVGGAVIFLIGGIFGAFIGGIVGCAAMPLFLILHRWLKRGEYMDFKHFLPIAVGITLTICSFILGLPKSF